MANKAKTRKTRATATTEKKIDNLPVASERAGGVVGGLTSRKAGETPKEYLQVTMENVLISGY
jgi:hypothetical protein